MTSIQEIHSIKKTPLYDRHLSLHGKMADFAGWLLPVYYTSILEEHRWVRRSCGVFDVSHLGEIRVSGAGAFRFLQYRLTNDLDKLEDGRILYSPLCDEMGFVLDEFLVYQAGKDDYYLVVNAANVERDCEALRRYAPDAVTLQDESGRTACVAVQGPLSEGLLERLFGFRLKDLGYYRFKEERYRGEPLWISRTGYTGEDGFEIFSPHSLAGPVWDRLMEAKGEEGVRPVGLGARNTLRLEAGNVLYGEDLDETVTPLEAGLGWAVSFSKEGGFVGRDMLILQKERGTSRRLVGFRVLEKPVAREHYAIHKEGRKIGKVTSGSYGPTVGANIGLGYVEKGFEAPGTPIEIEIHGRFVKAEVVKTPFVPLKHR
ncbi:MAG: glycine cleavage system aminomethyltransferase GcvT [Candidatus Omnitrophica bacterium]|nr:glycine cleavage system aminomethyltransferase GcvT [Candidatus Omnitrophota bacterium]